MRIKLYQILVNYVPGISYRYHRKHDGVTGIRIFLSWIYLLWLNLCYYVFNIRSIGKLPETEFYEEKKLLCEDSESCVVQKENPNLKPEYFVKKLCEYDVISFDVFDTLIFRPFAQPTDVFYLVGEKLGIMNFKDIRTDAERKVRMECSQKNDHAEITLKEIWDCLSREVGCDSSIGCKMEEETELSLCFANPFMLNVWNRLLVLNKRLIVVSDMYLDRNCIAKILKNAGFHGIERIYVSCEYRKSKANGTLFQQVRNDLGSSRAIHVGDNPNSDHIMAIRNGFAFLPYPNINKKMFAYRPYDMSPLVGSAYRGIVSCHLYNGLASYTPEYEYGFLYGGLFVLGYCHFIHEYCRLNNISRVLFLSRDGDVLKRVYDRLYPSEDTVYVYWSRKAAAKLMADEDRHDYFRRFLFHKVNQKYTIEDILKAMELEFLVDPLTKQDSIGRSEDRDIFFFSPDEELTDKNANSLRCFIEMNWGQVLKAYEGQRTAAKTYYEEVLKGCTRAVVIDIGWAGSGAMALSHLVEQCWNISCRIIGIVAGTNTIHSTEPEASEPFLQSGRLVSYMYSQAFNRDLLKKHDPYMNYNVYWELLLSSPTRHFSGFQLNESKETILQFGNYDSNLNGIREIQQGILDFAEFYSLHFRHFPYMFSVSGRDAYAPMLVAASYGEKYLKSIAKRFDLHINVD